MKPLAPGSRERKLCRLEAAAGNPRRVPSGPVLEHVQRLRYGPARMRVSDIAAAAGVHETTVHKVGQTARVHRDTARAILAVRPPHTPVGVQRRLRALMADGFPAPVFRPLLDGLTERRLDQLRLSDPPERSNYADVIVLVYDKLAGGDPVAYGAAPSMVKHCRTLAWHRGYAPSSVWDWDTIDDPDAIPEYTGACGTETGYDRHRRELPDGVWVGGVLRIACGPCNLAVQEANARRAEWRRARARTEW